MDSIQEAANVITEKSSATLTEKIIKDIEDGRQRWQTLIDNLKAREKVRARAAGFTLSGMEWSVLSLLL